MSPSVLARVISGKLHLNDLLSVHPARLDGYKRHKVKNADYPAVIEGLGNDHVLGTVVYNLTSEQVNRLDVFEGDEYQRHVVKVFDNTIGEFVLADVYLWIDSKDRLLTEEWDFEHFVKFKMENWISDEMRDLEAGQDDPRGNRFWNPTELAK